MGLSFMWYLYICKNFKNEIKINNYKIRYILYIEFVFKFLLNLLD